MIQQVFQYDKKTQKQQRTTTAVSNDNLGLCLEQSDQMVKMCSWTCRIHKIIDFEIFNPALF